MTERVLVRLPNWVGDVVMATPALEALRRGLPGASITVEGRGFLAGLLDGLDSFDAFLPAPARGWRATLAHGRRLAAGRFDLAVLLPDSARVALAPRLASIPRRVGYARDLLRRSLLTDALAPPRTPDGKRLPIPMVERYLAITRAVGCDLAEPVTRLVVRDATRTALHERLTAEGVDPRRPYLVLSPGASFGASKLYPADQLAEAAREVAQSADLAVLLAPGPGEEPLCHEVVARLGPDVAARVLDEPVTSLAELAALIADARLLISNDTGPRHIAVALDTPVVTILGPTDRRHTDYQLSRQRVLREDVDCSPCHEKVCPIDHRCMTRLAPARVTAAALELLP